MWNFKDPNTPDYMYLVCYHMMKYHTVKEDCLQSYTGYGQGFLKVFFDSFQSIIFICMYACLPKWLTVYNNDNYR